MCLISVLHPHNQKSLWPGVFEIVPYISHVDLVVITQQTWPLFKLQSTLPKQKESFQVKRHEGWLLKGVETTEGMEAANF